MPQLHKDLSSFTLCPLPIFSLQWDHRSVSSMQTWHPNSPCWGSVPTCCRSAVNPPASSLCSLKHLVCLKLQNSLTSLQQLLCYASLCAVLACSAPQICLLQPSQLVSWRAVWQEVWKHWVCPANRTGSLLPLQLLTAVLLAWLRGARWRTDLAATSAREKYQRGISYTLTMTLIQCLLQSPEC